MKDERDSIDFGKMNIPKLFSKIFFPTLIGMVATVFITIVDGIFIGQGVGSDAIAAVNLIAPMYMAVTGIAMMFGVGASVVASIHLSHNKLKAAKINISQAYSFATLLMLLLTAIMVCFCREISLLMGSTERLLPLSMEYMFYLSLGYPFLLIINVGLFVIRLDGSPKYAMMCSAVPAIVNTILDYIFIFPMDMGIMGAALASTIGVASGGFMVIYYMWKKAATLKWYNIKLSRKSIMLTVRNLGYQINIGSSALIGQLAVALMMTTGNRVFLSYMGEDGVAAFGVACFCYPVVYMIDMAVAQSAQPILSYNYGCGLEHRVKSTFFMLIGTSLACGLLAIIGTIGFSNQICSLFLNPSTNAHRICIEGLPIFALGFIFFAFNIACIGYYQSVDRVKLANVFSSLRGIVFPIAAFIILPQICGYIGIWLAVPVADILVTIGILPYLPKLRRMRLSDSGVTSR